MSNKLGAKAAKLSEFDGTAFRDFKVHSVAFRFLGSPGNVGAGANLTVEAAASPPRQGPQPTGLLYAKKPGAEISTLGGAPKTGEEMPPSICWAGSAICHPPGTRGGEGDRSRPQTYPLSIGRPTGLLDKVMSQGRWVDSGHGGG